VAFHHSPTEAGETKFSSLTAVHAADAITSAVDPSPLNHDAELDLKYLDHIGLSQRIEVWNTFPEAQTTAQAAGAR
jgi:hypothetical protein